ncbi:MAG: anthranilate phosphoribosyltransferase [Gammaproteobacteria bacterium]|nr:anthranilate phosphoribosyltransferase [Gammaproteobacteria bacterium]MCY4219024.1 anthranilate phosphoribosyltransferase [Gammaproteobacteria bacterium]
MTIKEAIKKVATGENLSRLEMQSVMRIMMSGEATDAQFGAFLAAMMIKGETMEEITGAATIMREFSEKVITKQKKVVDCVGTGGDGARILNVSTASAIIASVSGLAMAKHGSRAATGKSGSADLLEAAGVNIRINAEQVGQCIDECGIGFMFAPMHHTAMRYGIGPRKQIGIRTIFNVLGPLTNPAGARFQLAGVFSQDLVRPVAEAYAELGSVHTLVVCSDDGLDEISIAAPTHIAELVDGSLKEYQIVPEQFGFERSSIDELVVESALDSLEKTRNVLEGKKGPAYDIVALNSGATIYAGNRTNTLGEGIELACSILDSGEGSQKLDQLIHYSNSFE